MIRLAAALSLALLATGLAGCSTPCQDLGNKICDCGAGGTSLDTCKQQIKNQLAAAHVTSDVENVCSAALDTCNAPGGATFCEWIETAAGKQACGFANPPAP